MNRILLIGRVGIDPEIKQFDNSQVAKFSLATSEKHKNKQGEFITTTDWHNIVIWGKLAEVAEKWVKKGQLLAIEGKVKYRSWDDKNGQKKYMTEIMVDSMEMIGQKIESKPEEKKQTFLPNDPDNPDYVPDENDMTF